MPRKSPFAILLSTDEDRQLHHITSQYTLPYFRVVRAKIILLAAQGLENKTIAERLDVPRRVVWRWRKRFCQGRLEALDDQPRPGRPRVFPP